MTNDDLLPGHVRQDAMLMRKVADIRDKMRTGTLEPAWVEWMLQHVAEGNKRGNLGLRQPWATLHPSHLSDRKVAQFAERYNLGSHSLNYFSEAASRLARTCTYPADAEPLNLYIVRPSELFVRPYSGHHYRDADVVGAAAAEGLLLCPDWVIPELALFVEKKSKSDYWHPPRHNVQFNIAARCCVGSSAHCNMLYTHDVWRMIVTDFGRSTKTSNCDWLFCRPVERVVK
jgi:hypothetical protein